MTFTSAPLAPDEYSRNCKNSTGITTASMSEEGLNANGTRVFGSEGASSSGTPSATASAAAPSGTSAAGKVQATMAGWMVVALTVLAGLALS